MYLHCVLEMCTEGYSCLEGALVNGNNSWTLVFLIVLMLMLGGTGSAHYLVPLVNTLNNIETAMFQLYSSCFHKIIYALHNSYLYVILEGFETSLTLLLK